VAYFDLGDLSAARDRELEAELRQREPELPWEVTNQASVHLWFERRFGRTVAPLCSLEEGIATWPETATAVAVRIEAASRLQVVAPFGLEDLFGLVVRRNPARISPSEFQRRVAEKRWRERWPRVVIDSG